MIQQKLNVKLQKEVFFIIIVTIVCFFFDNMFFGKLLIRILKKDLLLKFSFVAAL